MKKILSLFLVLGFAQASFAEPVEDNSFLVEEAYNQEPGIVQFIQVWQKSNETDDWGYTFINEIPVMSQAHQFSYEIPFQFLDVNNKTQLSDVKLNYRYEMFRTDAVVSTGRVSVEVPSGDYKKGFGTGAAGYEGSMVTSVKLSDKWVQHWNLGAGISPDAKNTTGDKADNSKYFWGFSQIYLFQDNLNFMLEVAGSVEEETTGPKMTSWGQEIVVSPSIRYAIDYKDWQYVPGIAFPIGVGPNAGANETLLYLSIEGKVF